MKLHRGGLSEGLRYRLIALDLDGTLLSGRKEITPRTRAALEAARERGALAVIATGRGPHSARHYSRLIGGGPVICCNGAAVVDEHGEYISSRAIPVAPLLRCIELCQKAGVLAEFYTPRGIVLDHPLAHAGAFMSWVRPKLTRAQAWRGLLLAWHTNRMLPVANLLRWASKPGRPPVLKLMIVGADQRLEPLAAQIRQAAPGLEVTSSGRDNLEVMAAGVSKGAGLQVLGAHLHVPREAMLAFGDGQNDLEMLRYAGLGVAMGNAPASVRAAAGRVAPSCDEDGVAQVIEELCQP